MAERGRPSIFTEELAARICERLALGESLNRICDDEEMPGLRTVHTWLANDAAFSAQYSRARETQADTLADRVIDKAEGATNENAAAVRAYLDSVKWFAGVVAPRKYTPKSQQQIAGIEGGAPIPVQMIELVAVKPDAAAD
jgi:hypothetical protein